MSTENTRRTFIKNLVLPVCIGIHDHEKTGPQQVLFNIDIWSKDESTHQDQIDNVICYEKITHFIQATVDEGHVNLLETLAEKIIAHILSIPGATKTRVQIEKLSAIPAAESVGIDITRNTK